MADAILEQAPPVFDGFSMGGFVALEVVARAPKRVSGLALLSTALMVSLSTHDQVQLQKIAIAEAFHDLEWF